MADVRMLSTSLLVFGLIQCHAAGEIMLQPGGWIDIRPTAAGSRIVAVSSNENNILIVIGDARDSEVIILNESLAESARWAVPGRSELAAITESSVVLASVKSRGSNWTSTVCQYRFDGQRIGECVTGNGLAHRIVAVGDEVYLIGSQQVQGIDWGRANMVITNSDTLSTEVLPLFAAAGGVLARIDPASGRALLTELRRGSSREARMLSPELAERAQARHKQEMLIRQALSWKNREIWLVAGRFNPYRGLPVARFNLEPVMIGDFTLQIPVYDELKRSPSFNAQFANPTGHLVTDFLAATRTRLVAVDRNSARLIWYDLGQLR